MTTSNERFTEYVTSTAFHINLSHAQVRILGLCHSYGTTGMLIANHVSMASLHSLVRKGLLFHDPVWNKFGQWKMTDEGRAVCNLLLLAGLIPQEVEEVA